MAERIRVVPQNLREAAGRHQQVAEYLSGIPGSHSEIQASLDSLGPIYSGLAEAGRELLEQRRQCYEGQAADHAEMAQNLNTVAAMWERNEQDAAAMLRDVADDR